MPNIIPKTYELTDGWYWETTNESNGPFASEDAALNDYVDRYEVEEE